MTPDPPLSQADLEALRQAIGGAILDAELSTSDYARGHTEIWNAAVAAVADAALAASRQPVSGGPERHADLESALYMVDSLKRELAVKRGEAGALWDGRTAKEAEMEALRAAPCSVKELDDGALWVEGRLENILTALAALWDAAPKPRCTCGGEVEAAIEAARALAAYEGADYVCADHDQAAIVAIAAYEGSRSGSVGEDQRLTQEDHRELLGLVQQELGATDENSMWFDSEDFAKLKALEAKLRRLSGAGQALSDS